MSTRGGPIDRAVRVATDDERRVLSEIARSQRAAGVSDEAIGRACKRSRWTVARILAAKRAASVVELAAIGATVGLDVRVRAYPAGDPIRDAGQQRLLARLRPLLHAGIVMTTEVPLPIEGDLRAWDGMLRASSWRRPVEAETVVEDAQALERRLSLKVRDGRVDGVILVIANTTRNRRAIAAAPGSFGGFDRNARRVLRDLREGRDPGGSAILFL